MSRKLAKHWISAQEYERMGEAGILPSSARFELIKGDVYEMSPIGSPHAACVKYLSRILNEMGRDFIVGVQDPIRLDDFSEPQPDLTLLRPREDFYRTAHPTPADMLLVIEVADTTVFTDRTIKIPLYARAGIPEVWLVNLPEEQIEIYTKPAGETYESIAQFGRGAGAQSPTIEGLALSVDELFG
ncbi:MAG: hypothetical protein QOE33_3347 [Acidobacteriota bacterium]|nr:hypothetical protein [Acidobacteriota bacterium]